MQTILGQNYQNTSGEYLIQLFIFEQLIQLMSYRYATKWAVV